MCACDPASGGSSPAPRGKGGHPGPVPGPRPTPACARWTSETVCASPEPWARMRMLWDSPDSCSPWMPGFEHNASAFLARYVAHILQWHRQIDKSGPPIVAEFSDRLRCVSEPRHRLLGMTDDELAAIVALLGRDPSRSEEHTSELQSQSNLVCRLLLEKKKKESKRRRA